MGESHSAATAVVPDSVLEEAAHWYALLRSGEATDAQRAEWGIWLDAHVAHQQAWTWVERIGQRFSPIQDSPNRESAIHTLQALDERGRKRRQLLLGLAAMGGAGALGYTAVCHSPLSGRLQARWADHTTATGELRDLNLPDGSRVWLNTGSALQQKFDMSLRRLQLHVGEAFIEVASDRQRPLIVHTEHGTVQALSTRFNIRIERRATLASVYQGAVKVNASASGRTQLVQAGEQLRFTRHDLHAPTVADLAREAWTRGVILAQDIPLSELVKELRRYRRGTLAVADEIAHLRVFGAFPVHDPEGALEMLSQALPVEVRRRWPGWVSIRPRSP